MPTTPRARLKKTRENRFAATLRKSSATQDFDRLVGESAEPPSQFGQGGGVRPATAPRRAISANTEPGTATWTVR